jgi:hypothetical protein
LRAPAPRLFLTRAIAALPPASRQAKDVMKILLPLDGSRQARRAVALGSVSTRIAAKCSTPLLLIRSK